MTKDEAEKIADAIVDCWCGSRVAVNSTPRDSLHRIIVKHLCPKPKLEWERCSKLSDQCCYWKAGPYQIQVNIYGRFYFQEAPDYFPDELLVQHDTLAEAKAAAQAHSEANR